MSTKLKFPARLRITGSRTTNQVGHGRTLTGILTGLDTKSFANAENEHKTKIPGALEYYRQYEDDELGTAR